MVKFIALFFVLFCLSGCEVPVGAEPDASGPVTPTPGPKPIPCECDSGYLVISDAGPHDDIDVTGLSVVMVDTKGNDVTIGALLGGKKGQVIHIVKGWATNTLTLENEKGTGNQNLRLWGRKNQSIGGQGSGEFFGGFILAFDGTVWRMTGGAFQ